MTREQGAYLVSLGINVEFFSPVGIEGEPKLWAVGATQRHSRIDNFLTGLSIGEWGITQFASPLQRANGLDPTFIEWLEGKSINWLQEFYALLHDEVAQSAALLPPLKNCKIVRLRNGGFDSASRAFFPTATSSHLFKIIDTDVYTTGKSKPQQEKAKRCLADLGVREPGDAELVEVILNERYTQEAEIPDDDTYLADLEQFITLVETHPEKKTQFANYFIFHGANDSWNTPNEIFIDSRICTQVCLRTTAPSGTRPHIRPSTVAMLHLQSPLIGLPSSPRLSARTQV